MVKVFLTACLIPLSCIGQSHIVDMGVSMPICLKYNESKATHVRTSPFELTGLEFALSVKSSENSVGFNLFTGLNYDNVVYKITDGTHIHTNNLYFSFNPNMYIPSKWSNIKYFFGIGAFFTLTTDAGLQSNINNQVVNAYLDTAVKQLVNNKAPIIPYFSFGLNYDINSRLKMNWTVTQTLLNYYPVSTYINYDINGQSDQISMRYLPIYFGVRFVYFLKYYE